MGKPIGWRGVATMEILVYPLRKVVVVVPQMVVVVVKTLAMIVKSVVTKAVSASTLLVGV